MSTSITFTVIYGFEVQCYCLGDVSYLYHKQCNHELHTPQDKFCAECGRQNKPVGMLTLSPGIVQVLQPRTSRISQASTMMPTHDLPGMPFFADVDAATPIRCWSTPGLYAIEHSTVIFGTEVLEDYVGMGPQVSVADIVLYPRHMEAVDNFYHKLMVAIQIADLQPSPENRPRLMLRHKVSN